MTDRPQYIGLRQGKTRRDGLNCEPEEDHEIILRLDETLAILRQYDWTDKNLMKCAMNTAYCRGWLKIHFQQERRDKERKEK